MALKILESFYPFKPGCGLYYNSFKLLMFLFGNKATVNLIRTNDKEILSEIQILKKDFPGGT